MKDLREIYHMPSISSSVCPQFANNPVDPDTMNRMIWTYFQLIAPTWIPVQTQDNY